VILANMLYGIGSLDGLADIDRLIPDIYNGVGPDGHYSEPRVIKSHQSFAARHQNSKPELYRRNIYVVRHPVDAIRSYHHFLTQRHTDFNLPLPDFVHEVVHGARFPCSWNEHVMSWTHLKGRTVLVLRYEDLLDDPCRGLRQLADFLGVEVNEQQAAAIAGASSLASMRKLEEKKPLISAVREFVRKSSHGRGYREDFPRELAELVFSRSAQAMKEMGYRTEIGRNAAKTRSRA